MKFQGFVRENGQVGIRNHVVVMPGVICAEMAAKKIASECGAVFLANPIGCGLNPKDMTVMLDVLSGLLARKSITAAQSGKKQKNRYSMSVFRRWEA